MVVVQSVLHLLAAQQSSLADRARRIAPFAVGGWLAIWLAVAIVAGDGANFPINGFGRRLIASAIVGFGPMLAAIALLFSSRTFGAMNAAMPPWSLIAAQTYRVGGLMFLWPFLYYRLLPSGFAVPGAIGDFLTGLLAPFVAIAVARQLPHSF